MVILHIMNLTRVIHYNIELNILGGGGGGWGGWVPLTQCKNLKEITRWVRLIWSHSSASGNLNYRLFFNSKFAKKFELENSLN